MVKKMVLKRGSAPLLLSSFTCSIEPWVEFHHLKRYFQELKPMVMSTELITKRTVRLIVTNTSLRLSKIRIPF